MIPLGATDRVRWRFSFFGHIAVTAPFYLYQWNNLPSWLGGVVVLVVVGLVVEVKSKMFPIIFWAGKFTEEQFRQEHTGTPRLAMFAATSTDLPFCSKTFCVEQRSTCNHLVLYPGIARPRPGGHRGKLCVRVFGFSIIWWTINFYWQLLWFLISRDVKTRQTKFIRSKKSKQDVLERYARPRVTKIQFKFKTCLDFLDQTSDITEIIIRFNKQDLDSFVRLPAGLSCNLTEKVREELKTVKF